MREAIDTAAQGDSVGGILETAVTGLPAGVGEPWFDTVESVLSHALFSVPAVKGVAFGDGFALADMTGSEANDPFRMQDGRRRHGHQPQRRRQRRHHQRHAPALPLRGQAHALHRPGAADRQPGTGEETDLTLPGRHDPAIVHRARVVVDSVTALALLAATCLGPPRYGTDLAVRGARFQRRPEIPSLPSF